MQKGPRARAGKTEFPAVGQSLTQELARTVTIAVNYLQAWIERQSQPLGAKPIVEGGLPEPELKQISMANEIRPSIKGIVGGKLVDLAGRLRWRKRSIAKQEDRLRLCIGFRIALNRASNGGC